MKFHVIARFPFLVCLVMVTPGLPSEPTFTVSRDLLTIIDSSSINGTLTQLPTPQYTGSYTLRAAILNPYSVSDRVLKGYEIYDSGVFKATVYDVINGNMTISGTNFMINKKVNEFYDSFGIFVSTSFDDLPAPPRFSPIIGTNVTVTYESMEGTNVFYEILDQNSGTRIPTIMSRFSLEGDGNVRIYAGCLTKLNEAKRIGTLDANNFANFENLQMHGRCRTYVVDRARMHYFKEDRFRDSYKHQIGQQGVIMSDTFPYPDTIDIYRNYLIQPLEKSGDIKVNYEFADIGEGVQVVCQQYRHYNDVQNATFTKSNVGSSFDSDATFQEYLEFRVRANSDGVLIRYTVEKGAASILSFFLIFSAIFGFWSL